MSNEHRCTYMWYRLDTMFSSSGFANPNFEFVYDTVIPHSMRLVGGISAATPIITRIEDEGNTLLVLEGSSSIFPYSLYYIIDFYNCSR